MPKKKSTKLESNILIAINAINKIMLLFLGPFLTAYFVKTSQESIVDLSIYYILSDIVLVIGSFVVANIVKNRFRIGMFRIGVMLNFFYILSIVLLRENIVYHLPFIAIMLGVSSSTYWSPYNLFVSSKIDSNYRTEYSVKSRIVSSAIGVLFPVLLGSIITATNYELTAIVILFMSLVQIVLSFLLTPEKTKHFSKVSFKNTWRTLKDNKQVRKMSLVEFFIGMNVSDGALEILITILIFSSFKTNLNLGIITSITAVLSIIFVHLYGKIYKNKDDKNMILVASLIPVLAVFILLAWRNDLTVVIYNICYVVFTSILALTREIRLFNLSNSRIMNKNNQSEFFAIREGILNCGRIVSYLMLLCAGISGSQLVLNITMVILTLSILAMGLNIRKIKRSN